MTNRPALRAALVVSGLTLTGCGGTATLRDREPTNDTTTTGSSNDTSNETTVSGPSCDPNTEPTTAECCNQQGARAWDAATGTCQWTAVPGPFVPPTLIG
jgi:hypothetical protein